jgi:hypothetical protein
METSELKNIWQTLAKEKLIDKEIAKENIQRIITLKSSKTVEKLSKKLKFDYWSNIGTALLVATITIFATVFLHQRSKCLPFEGYLFLALVISFFSFKAITLNTNIRLLNLSFTTSSILDSLRNVKSKFVQIWKKESIVSSIVMIILTIYANIIINTEPDFSNFKIFKMNSLQGYVLIFSVVYLISLPWTGKYIFKKRFSGIIKDIDQSIQELNSENE